MMCTRIITEISENLYSLYITHATDASFPQWPIRDSSPGAKASASDTAAAGSSIAVSTAKAETGRGLEPSTSQQSSRGGVPSPPQSTLMHSEHAGYGDRTRETQPQPPNICHHHRGAAALREDETEDGWEKG